MKIWTIYEHPADFPDKFIAREFFVGQGAYAPTDVALIADTLVDVRRMLTRLYPDLVRIERFDVDEPHIVECWI
jgi:hypothetical protein